MKHKCFLITLVLLVVCLTPVWAGNVSKIGTAGAQELIIPVGARGSAMGGAVVANTFGVEAIYWNPAGLASMEGTQAMFSNQPYMADIDINYGAIATSIEDFGSIGVAAKVVDIGDIEETTTDQPEGTGSIFGPTLAVVGVTYARRMTADVQLGITGNFIHESIFDVSATGVSFDLGVTYTPRWRGVSLGIVMKNYGPDMRFSGDGFQTSAELLGKRRVSFNGAPFELPASINIGIAYNFLSQDLSSATFTSNFQSNNHRQDMWQGGVEYSYDDRYFLRGGYNYADQTEWIYGASFGGGLVLNVGETRLIFEYAWTETDTFDDNQYFTFKATF